MAEGRALTKEEMDAALRVEQDEGRSAYRKGGYHPVKIGEKFKEGRYTVYSKVGWGHFSTVWKAKDSRTGQFVALKVVRSASQYTDEARDEIRFLNKLALADPKRECCCMHLLDHFRHLGPHGVRLLRSACVHVLLVVVLTIVCLCLCMVFQMSAWCLSCSGATCST